MALQRVSLIGTGSFLPGNPVGMDDLERVLGPLTEAPESVQRFVAGAGRRMMEGSGVVNRHFAVHPETGALTHSFGDLAREACERAIENAGIEANDVDLLLMAAPTYDYSTPPTSAILQEALGIEHCAEMEIHSNCSGVGKAAQIAFDSLRLGRYKTALPLLIIFSCFYDS